jgi:tRNA modification GTPase
LESALEFVEDDLPAAEIEAVEALLRSTKAGVNEFAETFSAGRLLQDGIKVAIVGSPNVGKSSLFNRLVEQDRAIVTHIPGTTRDTLLHSIDIGGIPVVLIDTAGMRETDDSIESLGIERTRRAISDADLVLHVVDGSNPKGESRRVSHLYHRGLQQERLAWSSSEGSRKLRSGFSLNW